MAETFEGLYVKFGANTVEFDRSVKGINNALSSLKKDFTNINRQLKMDPDNVDLLNRKLVNLQEQARVGAMKIAELKKQQKALGESEVGSAQWNKLQLEIAKVESQMKVVDKAMESTKKHIEDVGDPKSIVNLNKELDNVAKELDIVNQKLELDPDNVELAEQKMKLLGKQSELAGDKVQELKKKQAALGDEKIGTEEWRQLQNEIGQAEVEVLKIDRAMDNLGESSRSATGDIKEATSYLRADVMMDVADKAGQIGQKMLDAGKMTVDAWSEIDEALDTVTTKTGLTGDALAELQEIAKDIATGMPTSFQNAGDAVGELNTQFGLTGEKLKSASELLIKYAEINETDISSSAISAKQAIEAYGLTAEDLGMVLDNVTKAAQDTGQSVDTIVQKAIDGAPQIKGLGLSFEEGAALIGKFEKSGVDSSAALSSLSKAAVIYAKDGKTLTDGLNETVSAIQNSTSETEALSIASEIFGSKAAPRMVDAIQRGAFSFDDLAEAAKSSSGTVSTTFDETLDPIDKLTQYSNQAKEGMAELGGKLLETVIPALEPLMGMLESAVNWFTSLNETDQQTIVILGLVTTAVMMLLGAIAPLVIAIGAIGAPVGIVVAAIVGAIAVITLIIQAIMNWGAITEWLQSTWDSCAAWLSELWTNIVTTATTAWSNFTAWLSELWSSITSTAQSAWSSFTAWLSGLWSSVVSTGQSLWSSFTSALSNIFSSLISGAQSLWSSFTSTLSNLWSGLVSTGSNLFNNLSSTISGIFNGILSTASNIWNSIKSTISNAIDGAKNAVSNGVNAIKNLFNFQIKWPHIPLPHFRVSGSANPLDWLKGGLPSIGIDWYAKGGIMTKPTLFGMNGNRAMVGGEAGAEAILPLNKSTLGAIGQSIANTMNTSNNINVNFSGVTIREEADLNRLANVVGNRIAEELQRKTNLRGGMT
ncbi:TPA: phage tail tape measure protein [Streptococcus agalactiae]|uniref:phage tail tape measure protein n=1 Tax=Streptococcus agalactiae TaxID=1311 RepID=UPI0002BC4E7D|nr:phage tail tape measure protein [Streptococcus agalactiae]HEP3200129.1 phage tail tape measure protein [Streptococcus pyogenes]EPT97947.1 phage tail tape measure protein [Streptococcus agalactiae BSU92]EPV73431.1 phage tail tape measure protein [Streptococcus agalactiae GB00947]KAF1221100.1 phage tail tape measure protein [Streptococcus agalactiae]KLJ61173.1 phage tail length tape measure protein [Streptococcus agalactiae]